MVLEPVHCPNCDSIDVVRHGKTAEGKQRYLDAYDAQFVQCVSLTNIHLNHKDTMTLQFKITNMDCSACVNRITKAIKVIDANAAVQTNPKTKLVSVETQASETTIKKALAAIGYPSA